MPTTRPLPTHLTPQQLAFVLAVRDTRDHLFLRASAGAGKTTTIKEAAWHIDQSRAATYFVYNRTAKDDVGPGLPPFVPARTIHADGAGTLARTGLNTSIQRDKSFKLARQLLPRSTRSNQRRFARFWDQAREHHINALSTDAELLSFVRAHFPQHPDPGSVLEIARSTLLKFREASLQDWQAGHGPDFTDQLWLPIQLGLGQGKFSALFVDEAQDLTPLRQAYIKHVLGLGSTRPGRLFLVGDPDQAVYQYAGADPAGMARLAQELGAQELPLSISWRCPASHISIAHHASTFIQASPRPQQVESAGVCAFRRFD